MLAHSYEFRYNPTVSQTRNHLKRKEFSMLRGHVTGHKKERKGATDWYKQIEAENLARIEREWATKEAARPQVGTN